MQEVLAFIEKYEIWFILVEFVLMVLFLSINLWSFWDYQKKKIELSKMYWKVLYFIPNSVAGSILKNMDKKKFNDLEG